MRATIRVLRLLVTLSGLALIALGVLFWTGRALSLLSVHMALGLFFVICLWALGGLALRSRDARLLAVVVLAWGLLVPIIGMAQLSLLPGSLHWVIQAVHLLIGIVAIGLGHALSARLLRQSPAQSGSAAA
ncbi:MAG: hypothetical protein ACREUG_18995 [Steroidobacteraceae bacterium]